MKDTTKPVSMEYSDVVQFLHCKKCIEELPYGESPSSYARIEVGLGQQGLLIWCVRHQKTVAIMEFEEPIAEENMPECYECGGPH